jgi:TonB family protein
MKSRNYSLGFRVLAVSLALAILTTVSLMAQKPLVAQGQEGLDSLVAPIAESIRRAGKKIVVVMPLADADGNVDAVGAHLAQEISKSLANKVPELQMIDPKALRFPDANDPRSLPHTSSTEKLQDLAKSAGAEVCVLGDYAPYKDLLGVSLHAWNSERSLVAESHGGLELTQEIMASASKPLRYAPPPAGIFTAAVGGIGKPDCKSCASSQAPPVAKDGVRSGLVSMDLVISADGKVIESSVLKSSSAALASQVEKELSDLRFRPALAPDGSPVAVHISYQYVLVQLEIKILADGTVGESRVIESPDSSMSERALHVVKTWKLKPATSMGGVPVTAKTTVEISFRTFG